MNPEAYGYIALGGLAGGFAGALILWGRGHAAPDSVPLWRRGVVLLFGTGSIAGAIIAYGRAFGPDAAIHGALVTILITAWLGIVGAVVRLPMPVRILRVLPGELALLRNPWTGVPAFGVLLKRTPLRHLGGRVFLAAAGGDPRIALEGMVAAEKLHLWALVVSLPWIARWATDRQWPALAAALLVQVPLNLFPVLHLRLAIWRTERCRLWRERRRAARSTPGP